MNPPYSELGLDDVLALDVSTSLVLSVNNRYARRLLGVFGARLDRSRPAMAVPRIVPLGAWLAQLGDRLACDGAAAAGSIDDFGARMIWQDVIRELESGQPLLDIQQAARLAVEADRLMDDWHVRPDPAELTPDHDRFLNWRDAYRRRLAQLDLDDANRSIQRVCDAAQRGELSVSARTLILAGFTEFSPRMQDLWRSLRDQGVQVVILRSDIASASDVVRLPLADRYAEWRAAASWACALMQDHPDRRYAIVAPALQSEAPLAHRVLRHVLGAAGLAYNVAVARRLAQWPLVGAALAWLRVLAHFAAGRRCRVADLGKALLAGGCVAHDSEAGARARLDSRWRHRGTISLDADAFSRDLAEFVPQLAHVWPVALAAAQAVKDVAPLARRPAQIRQILLHLGFPGRAAPDSHEWQVLEAFDGLLDRLGRLDAIEGAVGLGRSVDILSSLARDTAFQPQRDPASRLDVLGLLEAEGGHWDGVWLLGVTDDVLPAAPQPNPLLPLSALRRAGAPHATPERELQWAQTRMRLLMATAPALRFSHPVLDGEREVRPSPLIAHLPDGVPEPVPLSNAGPMLPLETLQDDQGPPVQADEPVSGGIAVLETQARNPLWAFARFRLGARELPDYAVFQDRTVRGQFLHRAMEILWDLVGDPGRLHRLANDQRLDAVLHQAVARSADEWLADIGPVLRDLECRRAQFIMARWLGLELERGAFEVLSTEKQSSWSHGPLTITVRLDRVDRLPDGRLLIIDYKSGAGDFKLRSRWLRDRPIELQLPFYTAVATRQGADVAGLVLGRIHARLVEATGVSDGDCGFAGVDHFTEWPGLEHDSWGQVLERWELAISRLAGEFASGHAACATVAADDLAYCDALPFLRLSDEQRSDDETAL